MSLHCSIQTSKKPFSSVAAYCYRPSFKNVGNVFKNVKNAFLFLKKFKNVFCIYAVDNRLAAESDRLETAGACSLFR